MPKHVDVALPDPAVALARVAEVGPAGGQDPRRVAVRVEEADAVRRRHLVGRAERARHRLQDVALLLGDHHAAARAAEQRAEVVARASRSARPGCARRGPGGRGRPRSPAGRRRSAARRSSAIDSAHWEAKMWISSGWSKRASARCSAWIEPSDSPPRSIVPWSTALVGAVEVHRPVAPSGARRGVIEVERREARRCRDGGRLAALGDRARPRRRRPARGARHRPGGSARARSGAASPRRSAASDLRMTPASPAGAMNPVRIALAISSVFVRATNLRLELLDVEADGGLRDEQPRADLLVGEALGGELEHPLLLRRRRRPPSAPRPARGAGARSAARRPRPGTASPAITRSIVRISSGRPAALVT